MEEDVSGSTKNTSTTLSPSRRSFFGGKINQEVLTPDMFDSLYEPLKAYLDFPLKSGNEEKLCKFAIKRFTWAIRGRVDPPKWFHSTITKHP